jgi:AraC-like DNA-binding protein
MLQARFSDLDEFAGALQHDDVEVVRMGHSGAVNGVDLVMLPDMLVRIGHQATPWDCIARSPDNALSIVFTWGYGDKAKVYGQDARDGSFSLSGPGTEYVSTVKSSGNYMFLPIPAQLLDERLLGDVRGDVLTTGFKLVGEATPSAYAMLRNTLAMMQKAAASAPVSGVDERLRLNLQNALLNALHYIITPALSKEELVPRSYVQRTRLFRLASEYLRHSDAGSLSVLNLCRSLHMPEPALRALFLEFTGLAPDEFLLRLRLQRMHHALRMHLVPALDLHSAALDVGFCDVDKATAVYQAVHGGATELRLPGSAKAAA